MPAERTKVRQNREALLPATGGGTDAGEPAVGTATVGSNLYWEDLPVAGQTVEQIRDQFREMLDIASDARAILEGQPVDESTIVRTGQRLIFQRVSGEKGRWP